MCVLCMFYVDWELAWQKKLKGRGFFDEKLVMVSLQETNTFFRPYIIGYVVLKSN